MLFESHFMSDFIAGKCKNVDTQQTLEYAKTKSLIPTEPLLFSQEAQAVMDAGREIWRYYMRQKDVKVDASYYDIRRHFQGENKKGDMNPGSDDPTYMKLWGKIKEAQKNLAVKIATKVYLYGFLLDETTLPEDEPVIVEETRPAKPVKRAPKPKQKLKTITVVQHLHIDHLDTLNLGDNVENKITK